MLRKFQLFASFVFAALFVCSLSAVRADSLAAKAYVGPDLAHSFYLVSTVSKYVDPTTKKMALNPAPSMYLNTGTWNFNGIVSDFNTYQDDSGNYWAKTTSAGYQVDTRTGLKTPVLVTVSMMQARGKTWVQVNVAQYYAKTTLFSTNGLTQVCAGAVQIKL